MDIINHSDNTNLRDVDVMIAYLRDEVSLEKVEQIEKLMEEDELYELSMQELSKSLDHRPHILSNHIEQTQQDFPQLLTLAKDNFITQFEQQQAPQNNRIFPGNLPIWPLIIAILIVGGFMIWMFISADNNKLHQNPAQHLVLDGDISVADAFMKECKDEKPGFGSGRHGNRISLYSALIEHYSFEKYEEASKQFGELMNNPGWSDKCQAFLNFYQGKTLLALKEYTAAARLFQQVIGSDATSPSVKNATHWYMANIFLIQKDFAAANMHLEILTADENQDKNLHLEPLFDQNYLETAKKYYMDINAS